MWSPRQVTHFQCRLVASFTSPGIDTRDVATLQNDWYVRKSTTAESGRIVNQAKISQYQFFPQKPSLA